MQRRSVWPHRGLPYLLLLPQVLITLVFFVWPALQAIRLSVYQQDPLGLAEIYVGLENFQSILGDPGWLAMLGRTVVLAVSVTAIAMAAGLVLAVMVDRVARLAVAYTAVLVVPYAVAPAVAGALFLFLFAPGVGLVAWTLGQAGIGWNPRLDGAQAMTLVILASAWKQIAYNFLFYLAGLQSIPKALLDAAAIDGASRAQAFWRITLPLLSPTTFFLLVVNLVYALFETFGVIHAVTQGGPGKATEVMIYRAWYDGFIATDLGRSAAQSVILMALVVVLTVVQFRFVERRVHY
jgi:sn-glycerol 3-phosphate transport system permease protein